MPGAKQGLSDEDPTIAELLKSQKAASFTIDQVLEKLQSVHGF